MKTIHISQLNEITLVLTQDCNLQCKYCDQIHSKKSQSIENIIDFFKKIKIKDLNKNLNLELFGGEPFLNKKLIQEIFNFLKKELTGPQRNLITIKINTNGTLWDKSFFKLFEFLRDNDFNIPNFIISYDGLWQNLRSDDHLTKIIEKNIYEIFSIKCLASITTLAFSYQGLSNQNIVKNYLYLLEKFPVSIKNIKHYLIREPWKWNEQKFLNYKENLINYIKFDYLQYKKIHTHLKFTKQKINEFLNPKNGCGLGETRISLINDKIVNCGLDNDFQDMKNINSQDVKFNCLSCEIKEYCDKTCPKKIFYLNKDNLNYWCEIKKLDFKLFTNYFKKYDIITYNKIFKRS